MLTKNKLFSDKKKYSQKLICDTDAVKQPQKQIDLNHAHIQKKTNQN